MNFGLGRKIPPDFEHVVRHRYMAATPIHVERMLPLVKGISNTYNQGDTNGCTGCGPSIEQSLYNRGRVYDWKWLWNQNKKIDGFPDTNPGDNEGSSVRAAMDVLRTLGHVRVENGKDDPVNLAEGITANVWATSVDEVRAAILAGHIVCLGINWYDPWFKLTKKNGESWFQTKNLGRVVGGHCLVLTGASDKRQAFRIGPNSWGEDRWGDHGCAFMGYNMLAKLIVAEGECSITIDKVVL